MPDELPTMEVVRAGGELPLSLTAMTSNSLHRLSDSLSDPNPITVTASIGLSTHQQIGQMCANRFFVPVKSIQKFYCGNLLFHIVIQLGDDFASS